MQGPSKEPKNVPELEKGGRAGGCCGGSWESRPRSQQRWPGFLEGRDGGQEAVEVAWGQLGLHPACTGVTKKCETKRGNSKVTFAF